MMNKIICRGYRFPPEIIQRATWLYYRFTLSLRDVEELLAERGIEVTYETIRQWGIQFGPAIARDLRSRRPRPHSRWHMDEMFVSIGGKRMYLWRAVDHEGEVLDCLVQSRRNKRAALKLMRKLLKKQGLVPTAIVTDHLAAYAAVMSDLRLSVMQERGKRKNNRAESSHVPIRRRERKMQGFKSPGSAQRFLSIHASVYNNFNTRRHLISAANHRQLRSKAFAAWRQASDAPA
jgi:putative transposase